MRGAWGHDAHVEALAEGKGREGERRELVFLLQIKECLPPSPQLPFCLPHFSTMRSLRCVRDHSSAAFDYSRSTLKRENRCVLCNDSDHFPPLLSLSLFPHLPPSRFA